METVPVVVFVVPALISVLGIVSALLVVLRSGKWLESVHVHHRWLGVLTVKFRSLPESPREVHRALPHAVPERRAACPALAQGKKKPPKPQRCTGKAMPRGPGVMAGPHLVDARSPPSTSTVERSPTCGAEGAGAASVRAAAGARFQRAATTPGSTSAPPRAAPGARRRARPTSSAG